MKNQNINSSIDEKKKILESLGTEVQELMKTRQPQNKIRKVNELQDLLVFRTKRYEEELLDEKIDIYNKVLKTLKS